jgi:RimJ/RimL family protein N-acetyltransferase
LIVTARLLLRLPTLADLESPPDYLRDPQVMDWLGGIDPPHEVVQRWIDDWERFPAGKFIVERPADRALVGRVGFNFYDGATWQRSPTGVPELGWALAREHWGHGYATEAALAVREWFGAPSVISLIAPANGRSQGVARRLGAEPTETVELPEGGPHVIWVHPSAKMGS